MAPEKSTVQQTKAVGSELQERVGKAERRLSQQALHLPDGVPPPQYSERLLAPHNTGCPSLSPGKAQLIYPASLWDGTHPKAFSLCFHSRASQRVP